jgi:hypothetical protein
VTISIGSKNIVPFANSSARPPTKPDSDTTVRSPPSRSTSLANSWLAVRVSGTSSFATNRAAAGSGAELTEVTVTAAVAVAVSPEGSLIV